MQIGKIPLTDHEEKLLAATGISSTSDNSKAWSHEMGQAMLELTYSLLENDSIPQSRLNYFVEPEFNTGRNKGSRKDAFLDNAGSEEDMICHPHFCKYLRYFIFGSSLPNSIKTQFVSLMQECGSITSGDILKLQQFARHASRRSSVEKRTFREELYKLALDCDLEEFTARQIRAVI